MAAPTAAFPWQVLGVSVVAALNSVAFGYDVGVVSGSLSDMAAALSLDTLEQEMATSGLNFVSGIGALLGASFVMDKFGRRATLLVASMLLLAGGAAVSLAQSFCVLLLGRALQGLGSGCSWCACAVYIAEIAPKNHSSSLGSGYSWCACAVYIAEIAQKGALQEWRGMLVTVADIGINVGILLGVVVDRLIRTGVPDDGDLRWRLAMGLCGH